MFQRLFSVFSNRQPQKANQVDKLDLCMTLLPAVLDGLQWPEVGCGRDPHSKSKDKHWATAYALIASAALRPGLPRDSKLNWAVGERAVSWLLNSVGCATTNLPVWGLPYARKIWLDEHPCRPGTGFNVPTVHSIQALCEYAQSDSNLAEDCKTAAYKAAHVFVSDCSSLSDEGRVFWYSTLQAHSYSVLNAISLMGGEVQRVAQMCNDEDLAKAADQAMEYVLSQRESEDGVPVWNYFGNRVPANKSQKRNDILHEAFVCQGLLTYKYAGGTHADRIDPQDILNALAKFRRDGDIFDFPSSEANERRRTRPARAIGLAQALYVLGQLYVSSGMDEARVEMIHILNVLDHHIISGTSIKYRSAGEDVSTYIRTRAHIILSLAQTCQCKHNASF